MPCNLNSRINFYQANLHCNSQRKCRPEKTWKTTWHKKHNKQTNESRINQQTTKSQFLPKKKVL